MDTTQFVVIPEFGNLESTSRCCPVGMAGVFGNSFAVASSPLFGLGSYSRHFGPSSCDIYPF